MVEAMNEVTAPVGMTYGQQLMQEGLQLLADGKRAEAAQVLTRARSERDTLLQAHEVIEANDLVGSFRNIMGLDCTISSKDDIFGFFAGHASSTNPLRDYLADGWRTLSELLLLLEAVDQPLLRMGHVLEFASGHGRFTRHLVKAVGADRVTVSDVVPSVSRFSATNDCTSPTAALRSCTAEATSSGSSASRPVTRVRVS